MNEQNSRSILLVDDDFDLCQLLTEYLTTKGFSVRQAYDGLSALEFIRTAEFSFDLMILDVMMPSMDGFHVLAEIRKTEITFPIIMLTAKGEPDDRIAGLELGADDYLTKPFEPRELLARIQAIMRRTNLSHAVNSKAVSVLTIDNLELNAKTYQALSNGKPLHLTPAEFRLLWLLVMKPGEIVSRGKLFLEVLGREESPFDRSLDIHISRLRKKLGLRPDGSDRLKSIRGEGYLYTAAFDGNI